MKNIFTFKILVVIFSLSYIIGISCVKINAACPNVNHRGWQKAETGVRTIHYFIEDGFTPTEIQQINNAFIEWSAKSLQTCIKLNFALGAESTSEYKVHLNGSPSSQTGTRFPNTTFVTNADTYIQMSDFNRFGPGNDTVFLKAMLHEIGHTMGMSDADPGTSQASVMNINDPVSNKNDLSSFSPTSVQTCDINTVNCNKQCPITYTRPSSIGPGSFPVSLNPQTGAMTTVTHAMSISNYNATTGSFTLRLTDYTTSRQNYQGPVTNSAANPDPYVVVDNTDQCINKVNGSIHNLTFTSGPVFGCPLTINIPLTLTGTENYAPPNGGNSGPFIKVYTGTTTPNSGTPYMHFLHTLSTGNVAYAHNAPSQ